MLYNVNVEIWSKNNVGKNPDFKKKLKINANNKRHVIAKATQEISRILYSISYGGNDYYGKITKII